MSRSVAGYYRGVRARVWRSVVSEGFVAHGRFLYGQAEVGGVFFRSVFSNSKETVALRKEKKRKERRWCFFSFAQIFKPLALSFKIFKIKPGSAFDSYAPVLSLF
jgi:hypothetical protein